jgi:hypothetical protein
MYIIICTQHQYHTKKLFLTSLLLASTTRGVLSYLYILHGTG